MLNQHSVRYLVRRLLRHAWDTPILAIPAVLSIFFSIVFSLVQPLLIRSLINNGIAAGERRRLIEVSIAIMIVAVLSALTTYLRSATTQWIGERVSYDAAQPPLPPPRIALLLLLRCLADRATALPPDRGHPQYPPLLLARLPRAAPDVGARRRQRDHHVHTELATGAARPRHHAHPARRHARLRHPRAAALPAGAAAVRPGDDRLAGESRRDAARPRVRAGGVRDREVRRLGDDLLQPADGGREALRAGERQYADDHRHRHRRRHRGRRLAGDPRADASRHAARLLPLSRATDRSDPAGRLDRQQRRPRPRQHGAHLRGAGAETAHRHAAGRLSPG